MGLGLTFGRHARAAGRAFMVAGLSSALLAACSDTAKESGLPAALTSKEAAALPELSLSASPATLPSDPPSAYAKSDGEAADAPSDGDAPPETAAAPPALIDQEARRTLTDLENRLTAIEEELKAIRPTLDRLSLVENDIRALLDKMEVIAYEASKNPLAPGQGGGGRSDGGPGTLSPSPLVPLAPLTPSVPLAVPLSPAPPSAAPAAPVIAAPPQPTAAAPPSDDSAQDESTLPTLSLDGDGLALQTLPVSKEPDPENEPASAPTPSPPSKQDPGSADETPGSASRDSDEAIPKPVPTASEVRGSIGLHLATYSSPKNLERGWGILRDRHSEALRGLASKSVRISGAADANPMFRLIAGPLSNRADALTRCETLRAIDQYCRLKTF